jgi:catechol 2,3-dioxygenase-like lactoylglutathione lyase family enzyme
MDTQPARLAPRLSGVLETSLYVADLDRAREFYQRVFALEVFFQDGRMCALGVVPGQVLLLFRHGTTDTPAPVPGGVIPPHGTSGAAHLCFAIPLGELAAWEAHLARHGITVESRITWRRGGTSLYFRDVDGHSLEVATPGLWPNH